MKDIPRRTVGHLSQKRSDVIRRYILDDASNHWIVMTCRRLQWLDRMGPIKHWMLRTGLLASAMIPPSEPTFRIMRVRALSKEHGILRCTIWNKKRSPHKTFETKPHLASQHHPLDHGWRFDGDGCIGKFLILPQLHRSRCKAWAPAEMNSN